MLMRPNKDETVVLGCHCRGDMAVRMRKVLQTAGLVFECVTCFFRVSYCHSLIFQYPLRASTIEKYFAPFNFGRMSSSVGVRWCGRLMARLRSLGSRHSRSVPLLLVTQTNEFTQSVGSSTLVMIP